MTLDQADDVAALAAKGGRRTRHAAAAHTTWPDSPPHAPARTHAPAARPAPVPAPGLPGLWPTPHEGAPRTARRVLPAEMGAPRTARDFVQATLREWAVGGDRENVVIAVSELVTNALRHGMDGLPRPLPPCPIQVVLLGHPRRLVAVVSDPGLRVPEPVAPEPDRFGEGGRGLLVVGAVSDTWGWARLATGGKAVWAAFDLRVSPPAPPH
ncbi:ATP-binding protein [Actinomadura graeca]|uniref:ATP-binding protein n=1 Tax=Actinomadura graeca TaxID=2750812 RepID=A0ABX8R3D9_9ACTN|nr:ATP-binding protein [Actinomadura graeca]QXJ25559.1 ATP-binding protein [Actinomadura graeca]